jgi:ABC-type bacteriocin/lantibiotic exporter with double-glycine peptidase domain
VSLEKQTVVAVVAYSAVIGGISLALPLAVQSLVNSLAFGRVLQPLIVISVGLLVLLSLAAALRVLEVYIVELLQRRMFADVARDVARRIPSATPGSGGRWGLTEKVNRFFDVIAAQKSASTLLLNATEVVMSALAGLLVLAFYHPYLLVFDLVLLASIGFVVFRLGRGGIRTAVRESHAKYDLAAWLESMARASRRFGSPEAAAWGSRRTDRLLVHWLKERSDHFRIVLRQTIGFAAIQALASAILLGLGAFLVWRRELSLGQLVASELIITSVLAQIGKFGKQVESYYDLNASTDKLGHLIDLDAAPVAGELLGRDDAGLELEVQDLELPGGRCTLTARSGTRVAITGVPHHARQRLFDAVAGAAPPPDGQVVLDGVPASALAARSWRSQVALLRGGDPVGGTLEDNLTSEATQGSAVELRSLLRDVGLGDRLETLEDGLRTWIHPDGMPLAPDELVALEVARALLRRPRLILVDRALDPLGKERLEPIWSALNEAPWTIVLATERPDLRDRCRRVLRWSSDGLVESRP